MRFLSSIVAGALCIASAAAQCNDLNNPQYNDLPTTYNQPNSCSPTGYGQAVDAGQANSQADIASKCQTLCSTTYRFSCKAWIAQVIKAADSNLVTGQCYFYQVLPAIPASCADAPNGGLLGGVRDNTNGCFAASSAVAKAYCSSMFPPTTTTIYTKTSTPLTTTTTTGTSIVSIVTVTICPGHGFVNKRALEARATGPPSRAPACLAATPIPASRLSSACACLSIPAVTVKTISVAPTSGSTTRTTTSVTSTYTSILPTKTTFRLVAIDAQNNRHYVRTKFRATSSTFGTSYNLYFDDTDTSPPPRFSYRLIGSQPTYSIVTDTGILFGAGYASGQLVIGPVDPPSLFLRCEFAADGVNFVCQTAGNAPLYLYQQSGSVMYQANTSPAAGILLKFVAEGTTYC